MAPDAFPVSLGRLGIEIVLLVVGLIIFTLEVSDGDSAPKDTRLELLLASMTLDAISGALGLQDLVEGKGEEEPGLLKSFEILTLVLDGIGLVLGATEFILVAAFP